MRISRVVALVAGVAPTLLQAQFGGLIGVRSAAGTSDGGRNSDRRGIEARVALDREFTERLGVRAELGFNQMQFDRTEDTLRFKVSENGFEAIVALRAEMRQGAFTGTFLTAGPVASFRAACGTSSRFDSNGRVLCDAGETFLMGYALGAGHRWATRPGREYAIELRYLSGVTAAQGKGLISMAFGIRSRRLRRVNDE